MTLLAWGLPIYPLFTFGGVLFFILMGFLALGLFSVTDKEEWGCGVVMVFLAGVALLLFGEGHPAWLTGRNVAWWCVIYVPAGVCWMFFRWSLYVRKHRAKLDELVLRFCKEKNINAEVYGGHPMIPDSWRGRFTSWYSTNIGYGGKRITAHGNKNRILGWGVWWPFSVIKWAVGDLVVELWHAVWRAISGRLAAITQNIWGNADDNFLNDHEVVEDSKKRADGREQR